MTSTIGGHAVVLGGSIAGLLAARVLSEHLERVTVLERDALDGKAQARKGVPHARHTHGLLAGGLASLERLFKGIREELKQHGAQQGDLLGDCRWHAAGGFHARAQSGLLASAQSRPLLEWIVRRRVAALQNVEIRDQISVEMLKHDSGQRRITGVRLLDRRSGQSEPLDANLVVDATGRGSRLPLWLESLGYARPEEDKVKVDLAYATQLFRRRKDELENDVALVFTHTPPNKRFGVVVRMEKDLWSVTLGGMLGDHPPLDGPGLRQFAAGLPSPEIHDFLQTAQPVSEPIPYKFPYSLRRRYEKLRRFPEGLLVIGDAVCSFNPVYGQGMSVAAKQAESLGECLRQGPAQLAKRFLARMRRIVDTPWQIAATSDFRFDGVEGLRSPATRIVNAYLDHVHRAAHDDPKVALAFHRVANLLDSPGSLFRPSVLARVLRSSAKRSLRRFERAFFAEENVPDPVALLNRRV